MARETRGAGHGDLPDRPERGAGLIAAAFAGDLERIASALDRGADIDALDPGTGLAALHIAVGRDDIEMCRLLLQRGASFFPDRFGRWPTLVAAECRVSDELCDFIAEREAAAMVRAAH